MSNKTRLVLGAIALGVIAYIDHAQSADAYDFLFRFAGSVLALSLGLYLGHRMRELGSKNGHS